MTNQTIRERINKLVANYGTPYLFIGNECGMGKKSRYVISRFMRGLNLDENTLKQIDSFLTARGY